jgi:hypothetical protein
MHALDHHRWGDWVFTLPRDLNVLRSTSIGPGYEGYDS